ncbi:MAG TPA: hypothetical protein VF342_05325 [Alphaproteobacteria bacterium]
MRNQAQAQVQAHTKEPSRREGIVVSTVVRLTTSDGCAFDEPEKAMEHEAFYQILKRLIRELGWADNEETAAFAKRLARSYQDLLPLLNELDRENATLKAHLKEFQRTV